MEVLIEVTTERMYKIFINNTPLILTDNLSSPEVVDTLENFADKTLLLNWDELPQVVLYAAELLEKYNDFHNILVFGNELEKLKNAFYSFYEYIEAAGGVIENENKETLFIFRNEKWDFPKGKIVQGEKKETAALREVKEETGLQNVEIIRSLPSTFHTYKINEQRILKCTYWYLMKANPPLDLKLQSEEHITDAKWASKENFSEYLSNSFRSIEETLIRS